MIIANYAHRLPADYDIDIIRKRAQARGPLWDDIPDLHFKGFLLRERGALGAIANEYSSLYLWRTDAGFRDFLLAGRTRAITDSFGRPAVETRFALDARRGAGRLARFVARRDLAIPRDADLTEAFGVEVARNREIAEQPGVVVAAVGVDVERWTFTRVLLSEQAPAVNEAADEGVTAYEVLYLAAPLLDQLPS
jgi:Domain of unknown function (DUF4865)